MKREHLWPLALAAVLLGTVAVNFWVMRVASADPSFAIEPDYYARAVQWDSTVAQEARNRALGWHLVPELKAFDGEGAELRVALTDSAGARIPNANIRVSALFVGRANQVLDALLEPVFERGTYSAKLAVRHGGIWELRFTVQQGGRRFTSTQRIDAVPAAGSHGS